MNKNKIIFWSSTAIVAVLIGLTPILTWNSPDAKIMMEHLGYPEYFAPMLNVFKILGALALLLPQTPSKIIEWAYAGYGFDFIAATVSLVVIDGPTVQSFIPLVFLVILAISYIFRGKLLKAQA
jgi:hypothetical protein